MLFSSKRRRKRTMAETAKSEAEVRAWRQLNATPGMKQLWTNWDLVISFAFGNLCGLLLTLLCMGLG